MSTLSDLDSSELRRTPSAMARARDAAQLGSPQPRGAVSPLRREMAMNASSQLRGPTSPGGRAASAERERRRRKQYAEANPSHKTTQHDPVKLAGNWTNGSSVAVSSAASDITSSVVVDSRRRRARVPGQAARKTRSRTFSSSSQEGTKSESDDSESDASVTSSEWSTSTSDSADSSRSFSSGNQSRDEAHGRSSHHSQRRYGQEAHRHDTRRERAAYGAQNQIQRRHFQDEHSSDWGDSDSEGSTTSIDDSALRRTHAGSRGSRKAEGEMQGESQSRSRSRNRSRSRSDRSSSRSRSRSRSPKCGRRRRHGSPTQARGRTSSRSRSQTLSKLVEQTVGRGLQRHDSRRERAARAAQKLPRRHNSRKHDKELEHGDDYSSFAASDSLSDDSTTDESTESELDRRERQLQRRRRRNSEALQQAQEDQHLLGFFDGWRQATVRATERKRRLRKDAKKARRDRSNRIQEAELGRQVREMARKHEQMQPQSLRGRSPARLVHKHVPPTRLETTLSSPIQHRSEAKHLERQDTRKSRVASVSLNISQSGGDGPVRGPELRNTDRPVIHRVRGRRVQSVQVSPSSSPTDMPRQQQQQQQQHHHHQQQQQRRQQRPRPEAWTTPAAREIAGVVEYSPGSAQDQRPCPEPEPELESELEPAADIGGGVAQPIEVPQGWETAHSKETGKVYYINRWTRELQYEYPTTEALPPAWTAIHSTATGEKRYANAFSGHTQLEFPEDSAEGMPDDCLSTITVGEPRRTTSPLGTAASLAVPQAELKPRSAAHWEFLRKEYETSGIATQTSNVKSLESVSALLFRVATEMHNEHTASNLAHGRKFSATDGARIRNPSGVWRSSLPLDLLARVFERCGRDVEAAHNAQEEMSSRIVHLEGLLADEHFQREKLESSRSALVEKTDARIAQTELDMRQEREELQRRTEAADAARLHAEKITKNCERKIAAARQQTDNVAEKLRLAELELTKRQNGRDPATLREQLERVRTEKVTLDQQLQASEHRVQLLEAEKEDLARRLALLSLDKTAKKRWTEAKHVTNQSPVKPAPLLFAGASSVAVAGSANAAGTSSEVSCRVSHQVAKTITPTAPTPPARPDGHSVVSGQKSPLASTLTNFASTREAGRGDTSATKKHRPPPPAR